MGTILGFTKILDTYYLRVFTTLIFACFTMFMFKYITEINLSSAGAIGSLALGIVINKCWREGKPTFLHLSLGSKSAYVKEL